MREDVPMPESGVKVHWSRLNNALFGLIYADPDLRARYERADSAEAQDICAEQFDRLAADAAAFVEQYISVER